MKDFNPRSPSGLRHKMTQKDLADFLDFNPRSPSGLRRKMLEDMPVVLLFQSTQPEWAATLNSLKKCGLNTFQSTQPEWAATATNNNIIALVFNISIHAARVGCDAETISCRSSKTRFQSTQPEWAATVFAASSNT